MTVIIGLLGPAGAGKSTAATYLATHYGARVYSLAAPLKEIAQRTLEFSRDQLYGTQAQKEEPDPRYGFSARWFLQRLGTEGIRAVLGNDVWVNACLAQIDKDHPELAVIEDVRFANESRAISFASPCGYVWRMVPPADEEADARRAAVGKHASELEWIDAPADIEIAPATRGVELLLKLVDDAAHAYRLFPTRREVPL